MELKQWSNRLIWATILIAVVRYAGAFAASDSGQITGQWSEFLTLALTITGIGMGLLDTVGGGLLFNGWGRVFPKSGQHWSLRFIVLTICVFGLLISGMVILVPFTVSRVAGESILATLGGKASGFLWLWASMVNLIPYILIAGMFVGNKMVTSLESSESYQNGKKVSGNLPESDKKDEKVSSNLPVDWRKLRPTLNPDQVRKIAESDPKDIVAEFARIHVSVSPRTASNWKVNAMKELGMKVDS